MLRWVCRVVFSLDRRFLVRICRVDLLSPDRSLRPEQKLRTAPRSRLPEPLAGNSTMESTFFLKAVSITIATTQSEDSRRVNAKDNTCSSLVTTVDQFANSPRHVPLFRSHRSKEIGRSGRATRPSRSSRSRQRFYPKVNRINSLHGLNAVFHAVTVTTRSEASVFGQAPQWPMFTETQKLQRTHSRG